MADKQHHYNVRLTWTGSKGVGTATYESYGREYRVDAERKTTIAGSADPAYRGDPTLWNPEELFVAALSACHQLWYLHLCAVAGVRVLAYDDRVESTMIVHGDGSGEFVSVVLHPSALISADSPRERALAIHDEAERMCYLARSVKFPVTHEPSVSVDGANS